MENNKKQTLDDAADDYCSKNHAINEDRAAWQDIEESFIAGAEWQEKQMYSEDEVENLLFKWSMYQVNIEFDKLAGNLPNVLSYVEWFKQFKKNK